MAVFQKNGKGDLSGISGELVLEFDSPEMASAIFKSIKVDNYQYVHCSLDASRIVCRANSPKASKLLHTLDDLLACIIVAEEAYQTL